MSMKALKARILALFDTPEQAASEEAAELIAYRSMRTLFDATGDQWDEASGLVDDLISDEEDDPTESAAGEAAEEEVEDARLDAIRLLCWSMIAALQSVANVCTNQQAPDLPPVESPRYGEALVEDAGMRAAIGKAISAANMKTIQAAHDASHATHAHTVALGAECNGMKLLEAACSGIVDGDALVGLAAEGDVEAAEGDVEAAAADGAEFRAACGCTGEEDMMKRSESVQGILAAAAKAVNKTLAQYQQTDGFTKEQVAGLNMLPEACLEALHALAAKSPADAIIQAKAAADAALAGHAHGLNAKDAADAADAAAKKKKLDDAAALEEENKKGPKAAAALKAAQAAGFATVEAHEEDEWLKAHPSLKALVDDQRSQQAARKAGLIAALTGGVLTDAQLAEKSLVDLETLAAYAKVEKVDYSGRGLAVHDDKDVYANPPDPYALALAKRREASAK